MRVMLINHFPLSGSGSGTYTRNIAAYLIKKGCDVAIVMPENTARYSGIDGARMYPVFFTYDEPIEGALPFNFPCFTTHPRSTMKFESLNDGQLEQYMSAFERAVKTAADEFKPDIIHGQHIWLLSQLAGKTGIPYVVTAHGTDLMGYQKSGRFRKYAEEAARGAKKIITISDDNDGLVRQIFHDCKDKIVLMRNGYDPERFYPEKVAREWILSEFNITPRSCLVLLTGKLTHFKGVDVLLEAARLYEGERPGEITTVIAGDGELHLQLKKQAENSNLRDVRFLGFLELSQLRRLYSAADVMAVPSRCEPFGLVAVEALACGTPVVATNQGGLPDIVNDEVGALVDVGDAFGLSAAILHELFRPDRAKRSARAARYAYDKYAQDSIIGELIEIYKS